MASLKRGRPHGSVSIFKSLPWEEQMESIRRYLLFGFYPPSILLNANSYERKSRKKQFRNTSAGYKMINGQLRQLKIRRKFRDSSSESKFH